MAAPPEVPVPRAEQETMVEPQPPATVATTTAETPASLQPPDTITSAVVRVQLVTRFGESTKWSRQSNHHIFDLKGGIIKGLATVPPASEVKRDISGLGGKCSNTLVFGGMDVLLWGAEYRVISNFYYYRNKNKPRLPAYVLLLDKTAVERDAANIGELWAGCAAAAQAASIDQYPEMSPAEFDKAFGWLRWARTLDLDTFVDNMTSGHLHVTKQIAESTLVIKHILHSSQASGLKNLLLTKIIGIQDPDAQVIQPLRTIRTTDKAGSASSGTRRSSRKTRKRWQPGDLSQQDSTPVQTSKSQRTSKQRGRGRGRGRRGRGQGHANTCTRRMTAASRKAAAAAEKQQEHDQSPIRFETEHTMLGSARAVNRQNASAVPVPKPETPKTLKLKRQQKELDELRMMLLQQNNQVETPKTKALREATEQIKQLRQQMQQQQLRQQMQQQQMQQQLAHTVVPVQNSNSLSQFGGQQLLQSGGQQFSARQPRLNMLMAMAAGSPDFARGYLIGQQFPPM